MPRLRYVTANIPQQCPATEIQNGGHQTGCGNSLQFEASDPEIKVGLDLCQADVLTLISFQRGVENRKCYDFHQYKCF